MDNQTLDWDILTIVGSSVSTSWDSIQQTVKSSLINYDIVNSVQESLTVVYHLNIVVNPPPPERVAVISKQDRNIVVNASDRVASIGHQIRNIKLEHLSRIVPLPKQNKLIK